jgi:hypothetical protein
MTILEGVSDKFLDWLNECPVQWFLVQQKDDSLIYEFSKEVEDNDKG